jgi:hypothetical protein
MKGEAAGGIKMILRRGTDASLVDVAKVVDQALNFAGTLLMAMLEWLEEEGRRPTIFDCEKMLSDWEECLLVGGLRRDFAGVWGGHLLHCAEIQPCINQSNVTVKGDSLLKGAACHESPEIMIFASIKVLGDLEVFQVQDFCEMLLHFLSLERAEFMSEICQQGFLWTGWKPIFSKIAFVLVEFWMLPSNFVATSDMHLFHLRNHRWPR